MQRDGLIDQRAEMEKPLRRADVVAHLQAYLPGLFDWGAPATIRDAVFDAGSSFFRTSGILFRPRVALRVRTGKPEFDEIYIHLSEFFSNGGWVCTIGAHVQGGYNFGLRWQGEMGVSTAHAFQLHWINRTPQMDIDLSHGQCMVTNYRRHSQTTVPLDELPRFDRDALQHDGDVAVDHLVIGAQRKAIALDLTDRSTDQLLFHLETPLALAVDLDGAGAENLGSWVSMERVARAQYFDPPVIYPPSCTPL